MGAGWGPGVGRAARKGAESGEWRVKCFAISPSSAEMPVHCRGDNVSGCRGLVPPGICLKWSCLSNLGLDAPYPGKWGKVGVGWGRRGTRGGVSRLPIFIFIRTGRMPEEPS